MRRLSGFSLMEMMIVLAIVAVVAAASAPMVNKKMVRETSTAKSPWEVVEGNSIAYNFSSDGINKNTASIGRTTPPALKDEKTNKNIDMYPKLYIDTANNSTTPHISFGTGGANLVNLFAGAGNNIYFSGINRPSVTDTVAIGIAAETQSNSVVIGSNAKGKSPKSVVIGSKAEVNETAFPNGSYYDGYQVAIGNSAKTQGSNSVAIGGGAKVGARGTAIGYNANTNATQSMDKDAEWQVAIGMQAVAKKNNTVAVGANSRALTEGSIAIGSSAHADHTNTVAIGKDVQTARNNEFILGNADNTVVIPGDLVVRGNVMLAACPYDGDKAVIMRGWNTRSYHVFSGADGANKGYRFYGWDEGVHTFSSGEQFRHVRSDRRLKNVGKVFQAGLAEIKKLEVFNYTFKDDKAKTPRVGVMAQDLKKIFPDAVIKGEDGFLRIRMEDMFYALVNAVKELDLKLSTHDKKIAELEKQNAELLKRIEALEKTK